MLDGGGTLGEMLAIRRCSGATVADLTIRDVRWNGVKLDSDTGVQTATVRNCVLRNIWQRGVKGVKVPAYAIGSPLFQIVMGVRYGFVSTVETLVYAKSLLPQDAAWAAFAIGRWEFPMLATAWLLGGHVRVGMEDNVYLSKGKLTPSNAALCEKAVLILDDIGAELATAREARQILGLRT